MLLQNGLIITLLKILFEVYLHRHRVGNVAWIEALQVLRYPKKYFTDIKTLNNLYYTLYYLIIYLFG